MIPLSFFSELSKIAANGEDLVEALRHVVADTFALYLRTHGAHWNVVGPQFAQLHVLFAEQYKELWEAVDEIAERIRALDALPVSSHRSLLEYSSLPDGEPPKDAMAMVKWLLESHEKAQKGVQRALDLADAQGDIGTVDLLTKRLQAHQKAAWMLRSLLR
jgi:starvation-inducible DNA-binding protein